MAPIDTVGLIHFEFWGNVSQKNELEVDVFIEDIKWVSLFIGKETEGMFFENPTSYMVKHLKPLFIN